MKGDAEDDRAYVFTAQCDNNSIMSQWILCINDTIKKHKQFSDDREGRSHETEVKLTPVGSESITNVSLDSCTAVKTEKDLDEDLLQKELSLRNELKMLNKTIAGMQVVVEGNKQKSDNSSESEEECVAYTLAIFYSRIYNKEVDISPMAHIFHYIFVCFVADGWMTKQFAFLVRN